MEEQLTKKYGLPTAIAMVIGIVIGSGIFFKAGKNPHRNRRRSEDGNTGLAAGRVHRHCQRLRLRGDGHPL